MNNTRRLYEEAKKIIPGGTQLLTKRPEMMHPTLWPAYYDRAKGCKVWDLDGNEYTDMSYMGIGSCVLGYADDDVGRAVKAAIENGSMCTLNCPEEVRLARLLCQLHPWASKVRYARTGGEAMAIAVRIARAKTGKDRILFCGYHGWHDWYLSSNLFDSDNLTDHLIPGLKPKGVPKGLEGTAIPFHYNNFNEFDRLFGLYKDELAAVVMEPIRNNFPDGGFLEQIRDLTDQENVPLIFDEITAGWRMASCGSHIVLRVNPDIAVFAKAISNGYPMAAIIGNDVMDAAQDTFISSTYWTERIGPVAALATIEKLMIHNVPSHLNLIGLRVQEVWKNTAQKHNLNITITGIPQLGHFDFNDDRTLQLNTLFSQYMLEQGFLATNAFYASYAHSLDDVDKYKNSVDISFGKIAKAMSACKDDLHIFIRGLIRHGGFNRLN